MCHLISEERYNACDHVVKCHLKYQLQYCSTPGGIPFYNPDRESLSARVPGRNCPEATWKAARLEVAGFCPACVEKKENKANQKSGLNLNFSLHQGRAGFVKVYSCAHERVNMSGGKVFQSCFSPGPAHQGSFGGYKMSMANIFKRNQAERQEESGNSGRFGCMAAALMGRHKPAMTPTLPLLDPEDQDISEFNCSMKNLRFSWRKWRGLQLKYRSNHEKCPNCHRVEAKATAEASGNSVGRRRSRKPPGLRIQT